MRKFLSTLVLMLACMATWAQHWKAPDEYQYPGETPQYVKVIINGIDQNADQKVQPEVAAFIDDECRATEIVPNPNTNFYLLRVWGNDNDNGKKIVFRAYYMGLEYEFVKTATYTGETNPNIPFVLNLDAVTGVSLKDLIEIEALLPTTHDLTNYIKYNYGDAQPKGESKLISTLKYEWDYSNSSAYFEVNDKNILTAKKPTPAGEGGSNLRLKVLCEEPDGLKDIFRAYTKVEIKQAAILSTGIESDITEPLLAYVGDDIKDLLSGHVTVLPSNVSNSDFVITEIGDTKLLKGNMANIGGSTKIKVSPADGGNFSKEIDVIIKVRPISIEATSATVTVNIGENVLDAIKNVIVLAPADKYLDDRLKFNNEGPAIYNAQTGIATTKGETDLKVETVVGPATHNLNTTVHVIVKKPVTSITLSQNEISVNVGDNVGKIIEKNILVTVAPADASDVAWTTNINDIFPKNQVATESGTFRVTFTSKDNPALTAILVVKVKLPVSFNVPEEINISKTHDTLVQFTDLQGDDFDPFKVSVTTYNGTASMADESGLAWNFRAQYVIPETDNAYTVEYDGEFIGSGSIKVEAEVHFANGWDWITPTFIDANDSYIPLRTAGSATVAPWAQKDADNKIIEIRSQKDLLYNDPTLGFFGSIDGLHPGVMYKIKSQYTDENLGTITIPSAKLAGNSDNNNVSLSHKGYTWVGYPWENDRSVNLVLDALKGSAREGDKLLGKGVFAEFSDGEWVASPTFTTVKEGQGFIYYTEDADGRSLDWGECYTAPIAEAQKRMAPTVRPAALNIWSFDDSQFADNMAIVATLPALEGGSNYSIGAFVNGECRGMGAFVKGNKMFINVAGKAGEKVSFRLYNSESDEYFDIDESVTYSTMLGSLRAPINLTVNGTTSIKNVANASTEVEIYDANGRRVNSMTKGVYIIKQGGVTKKVIK
ncbi:MAG: T9SS type A sorting domain-containing protein [Prevotellaceae bacterium]|nr:T9SS type A sorting domain-containing protein [Candidatus Minthosoma caballi]